MWLCWESMCFKIDTRSAAAPHRRTLTHTLKRSFTTEYKTVVMMIGRLCACFNALPVIIIISLILATCFVCNTNTYKAPLSIQTKTTTYPMFASEHMWNVFKYFFTWSQSCYEKFNRQIAISFDTRQRRCQQQRW